MLRTLHDAQLGLSAGHLGETAGKLNAMVVDLACAELRPILSHTTPHAMLNCVVRCCRIISGALNLQMKTNKSNAHVGADDFLPTFIWVVLRAKVPELVTSIRCTTHHFFCLLYSFVSSLSFVCSSILLFAHLFF